MLYIPVYLALVAFGYRNYHSTPEFIAKYFCYFAEVHKPLPCQ